ncbi:hypothetical protein LZT85_01755 [Staphylococcus epidermidis]|uniref:hypothetical protein n=1 Tax=Staphylococcus epidermidis TaxID=1282 RepID=UPI00066BFEB2|nr:hypothetical protein [Staphylococcus epidermidis]MBM6047981.1 hypothetical protein [Staphylococcus epidermidis]MCO6226191.1 hypothetical protein [Staphylococcus epidermidis]MCO6231310.1 hypothetical protein [Staphylococcus epidermidis]
MTLDSINFVWIAMMCLIVVALVYVVAHVCMIILIIKDKKRLKEFKEKRNREWIEKEKEFENRMKEQREEFYKRNRHITKGFDKHFKE